MSRFVLTALAPLALSGCLVYADGPDRNVEHAPRITFADASCYWDDAYHDYVWWFQADVADADANLAYVSADVYDDYNGAWVDAFELFYESDGTWFSAWQASTTYLDCAYYNYTVEITAEDGQGNLDSVAFETF